MPPEQLDVGSRDIGRSIGVDVNVEVLVDSFCRVLSMSFVYSRLAPSVALREA